MPPHARHRAHSDDGIADGAAINSGKACRHAEFDKLAHQPDMAVRHAADMATIIMDGGAKLREQHVLKGFDSGAFAAERGLGKGQSAKRADLLVDASHAPPVHSQAPKLHLDRMRQPRLERLVGGIAIPAIIHRDDGKPLAHQVGPPVRQSPGLIGVDPFCDQVAGPRAGLDAAFGAKIAKPGKAGMRCIAGCRSRAVGHDVGPALGVALPWVLQAWAKAVALPAFQLPAEQAALPV